MPQLILAPRAVADLRHLVAVSTDERSDSEVEAEAGSAQASAEASSSRSRSKRALLPPDIKKRVQEALDAPLPAPDGWEDEVPSTSALTGSSPAVPPAAEQDESPRAVRSERQRGDKLVVMHHRLLNDVSLHISSLASDPRSLARLEVALATPSSSSTAGSSAASAHDSERSPARYTLRALVRGAHVYFAPKPKFVRSPELEASLARIRKQHEEDEYRRMTAAAGSDGAGAADAPQPYSLSARGGASAGASAYAQLHPPVVPRERAAAVPALSAAEEAAEWAYARAVLSGVVNVLLSMAAVGAAAWYAGRSSGLPPPARAITSLLAALLVALAETVLYMRYFRAQDEKKRRKLLQLADRGKGEKRAGAQGLLDDEALARLRKQQDEAIDALLAAQKQEKPDASSIPEMPVEAAGKQGQPEDTIASKGARRRKNASKRA